MDGLWKIVIEPWTCQDSVLPLHLIGLLVFRFSENTFGFQYIFVSTEKTNRPYSLLLIVGIYTAGPDRVKEKRLYLKRKEKHLGVIK